MEYTMPWDDKALERRSRSAHTINDGPDKTVQGPAVEANINYIAKAYGLTGKNMPIPPEVFDPRHYQDTGELPGDLQSAMNLVQIATEQFMHLPADLRRKFNDSPGVLWDWLHNPVNAKEALDLGLLKEDAPAAPPAPTEPTP